MTFSVRTNDFQTQPLLGEFEICLKATLVRRGLFRLALCWLLAAFAVLIPVLHFILVPALLVLGVFLFSAQMKHTHYLSSGNFKCLKCQKTNQIKSLYFTHSTRTRCHHCQEQLTLISNT